MVESFRGASSAAGLLLVTRNLPPLVGGMERLNWHLADELSEYTEVRAVGPDGAAAQAPPGVHVDETPLKPLAAFLLRAQRLALRQARCWRPGVVLAGSGLTAPLAFLAARACGARVAAYIHGLDVAVSNPVYRWLWLPILRRMDCVIVNSRATKELAIRAGLRSERLSIVHPGVTLPRGAMDPGAVTHFRSEQALGDRPLLLSVGRLTQRKGLREFVAEVLPRIVEERPDVMLAVVGYAPNEALHANAQSRSRIQAAADGAGIGVHLKFLGGVTDRELSAVYQAADVHVFPVRHIPGDPEGFGMVAVEAAAQGLPTVAYATGGVADAVADGVSGRLVPPGDAAAFAQAVLRTLALPLPDEGIRHHAARFAWPRFGCKVANHLGIGLESTPL